MIDRQLGALSKRELTCSSAICLQLGTGTCRQTSCGTDRHPSPPANLALPLLPNSSNAFLLQLDTYSVVHSFSYSVEHLSCNF